MQEVPTPMDAALERMACKENPLAVCFWKNAMCQCLRGEWNAAARQRSKVLNFRPHVRRHPGFYRPCFFRPHPTPPYKDKLNDDKLRCSLQISDACLARQPW
ncbi:hypothetical protein ECG_04801 [Echinococcus granulosus]|nr:hypothetical protein ECG_04801 [Echinococcus granulosus]